LAAYSTTNVVSSFVWGDTSCNVLAACGFEAGLL